MCRYKWQAGEFGQPEGVRLGGVGGLWLRRLHVANARSMEQVRTGVLAPFSSRETIFQFSA